MKYVYGPVRSRRLGNSLGITTVPYKVCSFDCVYCQLKKTTVKTTLRKNYIPEKEIVGELRTFFRMHPPGEGSGKTAEDSGRVDCITFSGSGEPSLHRGLGRLLRAVRGVTALPIVFITNGSTMVEPRARREMSHADIVIPSLDAVSQDVFEKIDRPAPGIRVRDIIHGFIAFRRIFKGQLWLEVMLVRGLNDSREYLLKIKKAVDRIKPDRVQINSPVRPPSEEWVKPALPQALVYAKRIFGGRCDIV